ncbi:hypothetical protein D3C77_154190 [compost metagenome]
MGIQLDVLVGLPEHELLFVGSQVAKAAGLKSPYVSVGRASQRDEVGFAVQVGVMVGRTSSVTRLRKGRVAGEWPRKGI